MKIKWTNKSMAVLGGMTVTSAILHLSTSKIDGDYMSWTAIIITGVIIGLVLTVWDICTKDNGEE